MENKTDTKLKKSNLINALKDTYGEEGYRELLESHKHTNIYLGKMLSSNWTFVDNVMPLSMALHFTSFRGNVERVVQCALKDVPLYIMDKDDIVKVLAKWRLKHHG